MSTTRSISAAVLMNGDKVVKKSKPVIKNGEDQSPTFSSYFLLFSLRSDLPFGRIENGSRFAWIQYLSSSKMTSMLSKT